MSSLCTGFILDRKLSTKNNICENCGGEESIHSSFEQNNSCQTANILAHLKRNPNMDPAVRKRILDRLHRNRKSKNIEMIRHINNKIFLKRNSVDETNDEEKRDTPFNHHNKKTNSNGDETCNIVFNRKNKKSFNMSCPNLYNEPCKEA